MINDTTKTKDMQTYDEMQRIADTNLHALAGALNSKRLTQILE